MNKEPLALAWELSVLTKCLAFPNLTLASEHVGLSQPQISRIVKRLEEELQLELLDRQSRRHSRWTPAALRLSREFVAAESAFQDSLVALRDRGEQARIRIGALEGLMETASQLVRHLFDERCAERIELDVLDLNELSERFSEGELDVVLTSREIGRRKYPVRRQIGYQTLDLKGARDADVIVESPSEERRVQRARERPEQRLLVSNSLALKRLWVERHGARSRIPSQVFRTKQDAPKGVTLEPVIVIGSERLKSETRRAIESCEFFASTKSRP